MTNLYQQAADDVRAILEDTANGFGIDVLLIDPDDFSSSLRGIGSEVGLPVDPETGHGVTSRRASMTLPLQAIFEAGFPGRPFGESRPGRKPWRMEFQLPGENTPRLYKVFETWPDDVGCIVCFLEEYKF